jgi:hypothetical protein
MFRNDYNEPSTIKSSNQIIGIGFSTILFILALWPLSRLEVIRWIFIGASAGLLALALLRPNSFHALTKLWFGFGFLLHRISNPILLGVIFYGVVTPIRLLLWVFRKDCLEMDYNPDARSYWVERDSSTHRSSMMRQY